MNKLKIVSLFVAIIFMASCSDKVKFPVSNVTPSADITASIEKDKNGNFNISITAKNLASADRLTPPQNVYVAWIVKDKGGIINLGQLTNKNASTVSIKTLTSQEFSEVFITAEQDGDISYPQGVEISRIIFKE
jgi:PBP1b-binding outer membrane lipoprotein LpoB